MGREASNELLGIRGHAEVINGEMAKIAMGIDLATVFAAKNPSYTVAHPGLRGQLVGSSVRSQNQTENDPILRPHILPTASKFLDANQSDVYPYDGGISTVEPMEREEANEMTDWPNMHQPYRPSHRPRVPMQTDA